MTQIATPAVVHHFANLLTPHIGEFDWDSIPFHLDETKNGIFGFCSLRVLRSSGRKKQFKGYLDGIPSITINRGIYELFPNIANEVIIPHEMGHVAQWITNRQPGHDQFFDWTMRKMNVQEGATFDHDSYGMTEQDRLKLNLLTGKQKKLIIEHVETGEKFTITNNMWTRMIHTPRRTAKGLILRRDNCRVVDSSGNL